LRPSSSRARSSPIEAFGVPPSPPRATLRAIAPILALELAHAGLARVVGDDGAQRGRP